MKSNDFAGKDHEHHAVVDGTVLRGFFCAVLATSALSLAFLAAPVLAQLPVGGTLGPDPIEEDIEDAVEDQVEDSVEDDVEEDVEEDVAEAVEDDLEDALEGTLEDVVEQATEQNIQENIEENIEETIEQTVDATVENTIDDTIISVVEEQVEESIADTLEAGVGESVDEAITLAVEDQVEDAFEEALEVGISDAIEADIEESVAEVVEADVAADVEESIAQSVEASVESNVEASVEETLESELISAVEDDVEAGVEAQLESDVEAAVEDSVEESIAGALEESVESTVSESLEEGVEASVQDAVESTVEEAVAESVQETVEGSVEQSVAAIVEEEVEESVEGAVESAVEDSVEDNVEQRVAAVIEDRLETEIDEIVDSLESDLEVDEARILKEQWLVMAEPGVFRELSSEGYLFDTVTELPGLGLRLAEVAAPSTFDITDVRDGVIDVVGKDRAEVDLNHFYTAGVPEAVSGSGMLPRKAMPFPEDLDELDVRVGMIDSRVDTDHPALVQSSIETRSFARSGAEAPEFHGTAIASIIAANSPEYRGLAPNAQLYAASVFELDEARGEVASTVSLIRALDWLISSGVDVVNISLAGPPNRLLERALASAVKQDMVVMAAAGNGGPVARPMYPAAYETVVAVTAVDATQQVFRLANRGDYLALAAPGVDLRHAQPGGGFAASSGTSFAVPFAVTAAARLSRLQPEVDIISMLLESAMDLGPPGRDQIYGYGLLTLGSL